MSDISIHWAGLAKVAEVSLVFGVGIVSVFALGVLGLSRLESVREGSVRDGSVRGSTVGAGGRVGAYALAGAAFTVCAAAVAYGLYLIIPQLH